MPCLVKYCSERKYCPSIEESEFYRDRDRGSSLESDDEEISDDTVDFEDTDESTDYSGYNDE